MVAISSKSILLSDKTIKELELPKELPKELPVIKEEVKEEVKELPKEESYGELIDIKPYPHEHAARQTSPDKYVRFRRQNNKFAAGLHAIFGITSDGTVELQSIRADSSKYTVEKFKEWLEKNNFKTNIEPAKEKAYIKVIRSGNEPAKRYMKIVRSGNYNLKEYIEIYKKHKSGKII
jgi:acylphosphatase